MAQTCLFTTTMQGVSNLPEDRFVNTWHFMNTNMGLPTPSDYDNVRDMLADWWIKNTGGAPLVNWLTNASVTSTVTVKAYDEDAPIPRVPVYESSFALTGLGSGAPLPSEVAIVASYQAAKESGTDQASRRNRVYLGPLIASANDSTGRPATGLRNSIIGSFVELNAAASASVSWDWVVYSPKNHDQYVVHDAWVDNAWDTQRRRGLQPTARVTTTF